MRSLSFRMTTVLGSVVAVLLAVPLGVASASSTAPGSAMTSVNRAGYTVLGGVKSVSAGWTVPAVTCGAGASYSSFRIGLSRGMRTIQLGAAADCHHGTPRYYAWVSHGHRRVVLHPAVEAGDVMHASISAPGSQVSYDITNRTQGWGMGSASSSHATYTTAAVVVNARTSTSGVLRLADFGSARFHARVDHAPISADGSNAVTMRSRAGVTMARPGPLTPAGGFRVTWVHA